MAHWEVVVPIVKLGFCGGGDRLMSSGSWARGAGTPALMGSLDVAGVSTALSTPSVGWKTSWS